MKFNWTIFLNILNISIGSFFRRFFSVCFFFVFSPKDNRDTRKILKFLCEKYFHEIIS